MLDVCTGNGGTAVPSHPPDIRHDSAGQRYDEYYYASTLSPMIISINPNPLLRVEGEAFCDDASSSGALD